MKELQCFAHPLIHLLFTNDLLISMQKEIIENIRKSVRLDEEIKLKNGDLSIASKIKVRFSLVFQPLLTY